jgi:hypothetical protein
MLSDFLLSVVKLNVANNALMLDVASKPFMLSVVMLSVAAPPKCDVLQTLSNNHSANNLINQVNQSYHSYHGLPSITFPFLMTHLVKLSITLPFCVLLTFFLIGINQH